MGRVSSFRFPGLSLWFNSDDHLPPHLHAELPGEWEVRVFFLRSAAEMFETKWTTRRRRPSRADLKALAGVVVRHRGELLAEWERTLNPPGTKGAR